MESEASPQLMDASRMALLKSATNHPGQLVQGNPGSVSTALQQIQARTQLATDIKTEVNMSVTQRSLPMASTIYGQVMQSKSGMVSAGLNQGVGGLPLRGWPLTGIDQVRPTLSAQVQKPYLQNPIQSQLLTPRQRQQILAQAQAQGNLGTSPNYADMDPRRFRVLRQRNINTKDGQSTGIEGFIGSPMQSSSPKVRELPQDQAEYMMKMKMAQMQQSSSQQQDSSNRSLPKGDKSSFVPG